MTSIKDKLTFICDHEPGCENEDEYFANVPYFETWTTDGLKEIIPSEEPPELQCAYCGAHATIVEQVEPKKQRKAKIESLRML